MAGIVDYQCYDVCLVMVGKKKRDTHVREHTNETLSVGILLVPTDSYGPS